MTSTTAFRIDGGNHKEGQQQQMQHQQGQPQVPYSPSGASHLQSKRPPNIHIGSSNTAEMNGGTTTSTAPAPPTTAQTVMAPKVIQLSANGQHKLEAHARSVTPPPSQARPIHQSVLSAESMAGSEDSAPSTADGSIPPAVVVHSVTRTVPFFDFDLTSKHQPNGAGTTMTAVVPSNTSRGLVKRNGYGGGHDDVKDSGTTVVYVGNAAPLPPQGGNMEAYRAQNRDIILNSGSQHQQHLHPAANNNNNNIVSTTSTPYDHDDDGASASPTLDPNSNGKNIPRKVLLRNLALFVILKILGSFDSGAFSATLNGENGITESWGLSVAQQGTLSSSVFLGNMIGCAVAGHLFTIYSAKLLLLVSLVIHGFFTFLFASAESYEFALLCRFFIGTTLAFIVVYTPVWVDEFSPKSSAATWMALQNAGVPIGIMIGFVIGGLMPTYTSVSWEWSFYFKSIVMVPIVAIVAKTERSTLDSGNQAATNAEFQQQVNKKMEQVERARAEKLAALAAQSPANSAASGESIEVQPAAASSPKSPAVEAISQAVGESLRRFHYIGSRLMRNSVWVANMLSLSSLYFVVSGLQTFVTSYLRDDPFNASMETITIGFGCAVVTAPVFGVVAGGILLDRIGGYHGNLVRASRFALMWGVCAAFFAVICIFLRTTLSFLLIVWVLLFCGGAIIPPGSGINMASLPQHLRPSGSSVAQMSFNFLGNFSGPLVCGWVAEWTGSLAWGIRAVLCMGVVGVIPMSLSAVFATRRAAKQALVESANAQAALRRQQQQQQHQQQQQQQLENDDANAASGYHSDSSEEFGVGGRHAVGAPTPGDHHYYTSNMSIMAALEEAVEAKQDPLASSTRRSGHESPRHADSDIELMSFVTGAGNNNQRQSGSSDRTSPAGAGNSSFRPASNNNNNNNNSNNGIIAAYNSANLFADSVGIDVVSGAASASGGGLAVGGTSPQRTTPHLKSNGGSFRGTPHSTTSMRHKQQQQQDPFSPLQANNSTSGPPSQNRARSSSHRSQSTPTAGLVQILPAGDEDDSGDAGIIARGMCGVYTSSRRPTMAHREVDDDDDGRDRSDALDSAQFNMSFPYQHSFGMDVVRGLLNLESPQIRSASIGNNNNNNNNNPARSTPTPPPLASANSPQLRPAAGTPLQQFEQESPPLPSLTRRKSSRQASGESSS